MVDIDREVTLDMENIEARSLNGFLPVSFLLGLVTGTVPPVRTLPAELPPPPPPLPPTPSSADDLDWSAGSGDCWPDTADPTDTDSSNTIASDKKVLSYYFSTEVGDLCFTACFEGISTIVFQFFIMVLPLQ